MLRSSQKTLIETACSLKGEHEIEGFADEERDRRSGMPHQKKYLLPVSGNLIDVIRIDAAL